MRRVLTLLVTAVLIASAAPSLADEQERTVTRPYTITRGHIQFSSHGVAWMGTQAEFFRARPGEQSVTISLTDNTGTPVRGRVDLGADVVEFCSETPEPIAVAPRQKFGVHAIFGLCDAGVSIATEGTITVTFSR